MPRSNQILWSKIKSFTIGNPDAALSFEDRLARETGWPRDFAQRVIEEYRKFLYLAVVAGHPVTPSDQVDQAWHLHLTYTRSYWVDLCQDILGRELHHDPTQGGMDEGNKFDDWYRKTKRSYTREFDESAPKDVWPIPAVRFRAPAFHRRIDERKYFVIGRRVSFIAMLLSAVFCAAMGIAFTQDPFANEAQNIIVVGLGFMTFLMVAGWCVLWVLRRGATGNSDGDGDVGRGCSPGGSTDSGGGCGGCGASCSGGCGGCGGCGG